MADLESLNVRQGMDGLSTVQEVHHEEADPLAVGPSAVLGLVLLASQALGCFADQLEAAHRVDVEDHLEAAHRADVWVLLLWGEEQTLVVMEALAVAQLERADRAFERQLNPRQRMELSEALRGAGAFEEWP